MVVKVIDDQNISNHGKYLVEGDACKKCKGITLIELIIAMSISAILMTVIVGVITNLVTQYSQQKKAGESTMKVLYLTQVFNTLDQWPEIRVKTDKTAIKIDDNTVSPSKEKVYYEQNGSIYKEEFINGAYKGTVLIAKNFSINFSLESDPSYSKDMIKIDITDNYGGIWSRRISLRDCEVVGTY